MKIRLARSADVDRIAQLRMDAARWLASIGSDQWSDISINDTEFRRRVEGSIANGETWVAVDDHEVVLGTIAIDQHTNPGLWGSQELAESLIIHRMIRDARAPRGTGQRLLQHAIEVARRSGRRWLRLDAWTTNRALHRYYEAMGFQHVRTVEGHHTLSAALFEYPVFSEIPNDIKKSPIEVGGSDHENSSPPDHWHRVRGLTVYTPVGHPAEGDLEMSSDSRPLHLWHDGTCWLISELPPSALHNTLAKHVLDWMDGPALSPSQHYLIKHMTNEQDCRVVLHKADTPEDCNPHQEASVRKTP